jgi:hypothetical protein
VIPRVLLAALVAAVLTASLGAGTATAGDDRCHVATALGDRPHELDFRARCSFEMYTVRVSPADPAIVRAVRKDVQLRNPDPEDHFRCRRSDGKAKCSGRAGSGVRISGALRMHGRRCRTATRFDIFGGMDCDTPGVACPSIGYAASLRDPRPSGCGR